MEHLENDYVAICCDVLNLPWSGSRLSASSRSYASLTLSRNSSIAPWHMPRQASTQPASLVGLATGADLNFFLHDLAAVLPPGHLPRTNHCTNHLQPLAPPSQLMSTTMTVSANDVVWGILRTSAVVFQLVHQP